MGYDLHITRRKRWFGDGDDISLEEWCQFCATDLSLEVTGRVIANTSDGEAIEYESDGLAMWSPPAKGLTRLLGRKVEAVPFDFQQWAVVVKNPSDATIAKMCRIADALGARVQGDDGEFYREDGSHYHDEG